MLINVVLKIDILNVRLLDQIIYTFLHILILIMITKLHIQTYILSYNLRKCLYFVNI